MSELKYYKLRHIVSALASPDFTTGVVFDNHDEVYYKSEADKVIEELEKKLDLYKRGWEESDRLNASIYAELRHSKYKRCLAMATACHEQVKHYKVEYDADEGFGDNWLKWIRWAKKVENSLAETCREIQGGEMMAELKIVQQLEASFCISREIIKGNGGIPIVGPGFPETDWQHDTKDGSL